MAKKNNKIKKIFHIITLFPDMFKGPFSESMIKRAKENGLIDIQIYNLRDYGLGKHKQVDDNPYGGGAGMVMRVDVVNEAIANIKSQILKKDPKTKYQRLKTILLTPQGQRLTQKKVKSLSQAKDSDLILICGHYEGFDERIRDLVDEEISIGDYILTGGEIPAMVIVDAVSRLIPGVLGKEESHKNESFENGLLEYPQYTRPEEFEGKKVPEVLLSGNHGGIEKWRKEEAIKRTKKRRKNFFKIID